MTVNRDKNTIVRLQRAVKHWRCNHADVAAKYRLQKAVTTDMFASITRYQNQVMELRNALLAATDKKKQEREDNQVVAALQRQVAALKLALEEVKAGRKKAK